MTLYLLITLQVLDLLTTVVALRNPKLTEGNGLLKSLMNKLGVLPTLLGAKGACIGLLLWVAPLIPVVVLYLLCGFYAWVIWNNLKLIRTH